MANFTQVPELAGLWQRVCAALADTERAAADRAQCTAARDELRRIAAGVALVVTQQQSDALREIVADEPRRVEALRSAEAQEALVVKEFAEAGVRHYSDQRDGAEVRVAQARQAVMDAEKALADATETAKGAPTAWRSWVKQQSWRHAIDQKRMAIRAQLARPQIDTEGVA